ncbi:unnamed protein product [Amoebophrya sp. A25]|nr:unnamed protein product [Amoebophrya sp. A25]|eukprot:GSA25T00001530001.1
MKTTTRSSPNARPPLLPGGHRRGTLRRNPVTASRNANVGSGPGQPAAKVSNTPEQTRYNEPVFACYVRKGSAVSERTGSNESVKSAVGGRLKLSLVRSTSPEKVDSSGHQGNNAGNNGFTRLDDRGAPLSSRGMGARDQRGDGGVGEPRVVTTPRGTSTVYPTNTTRTTSSSSNAAPTGRTTTPRRQKLREIEQVARGERRRSSSFNGVEKVDLDLRNVGVDDNSVNEGEQQDPDTSISFGGGEQDDYSFFQAVSGADEGNTASKKKSNDEVKVPRPTFIYNTPGLRELVTTPRNNDDVNGSATARTSTAASSSSSTRESESSTQQANAGSTASHSQADGATDTEKDARPTLQHRAGIDSLLSKVLLGTGSSAGSSSGTSSSGTSSTSGSSSSCGPTTRSAASVAATLAGISVENKRKRFLERIRGDAPKEQGGTSAASSGATSSAASEGVKHTSQDNNNFFQDYYQNDWNIYEKKWEEFTSTTGRSIASANDVPWPPGFGVSSSKMLVRSSQSLANKDAFHLLQRRYHPDKFLARYMFSSDAVRQEVAGLVKELSQRLNQEWKVVSTGENSQGNKR